MASRLKQTLTPCQEKELFALELSQESKKQLEDLLRLRPKNWLTFFPKGVDTLFKEIMRSVKIKQIQQRGKAEKLVVEEALIILNQPLELRDVLTPLQYQLWNLLIQGCEEITSESEDEVEKEEEGIVMKPVRSSDSSSDEDEPKKRTTASSSSDEDEPKKRTTASSSNEESDEEKKESEKKIEDSDSDSDTLAPVDDLISPSPTLETPKMPTLPQDYKIPKIKTSLASDGEDLPSSTLESLKKGKSSSYCGQFIFHSFSFYRRTF